MRHFHLRIREKSGFETGKFRQLFQFDRSDTGKEMGVGMFHRFFYVLVTIIALIEYKLFKIRARVPFSLHEVLRLATTEESKIKSRRGGTKKNFREFQVSETY